MHQVLEGRQKLGLKRREAFKRAANMIITKLRTWTITYEPSVEEIRARFSEVPDALVAEVLRPYRKRVTELLCEKHSLDKPRFSGFS